MNRPLMSVSFFIRQKIYQTPDYQERPVHVTQGRAGSTPASATKVGSIPTRLLSSRENSMRFDSVIGHWKPKARYEKEYVNSLEVV